MRPALEPFLLAAELSARHVYWRSRYLQRARSGKRGVGSRVVRVDLDALVDRLRETGVRPGAVVMVHSSTACLALDADAGAEPIRNPLSVANRLLRELLELTGADGTLTMPTHAGYPQDPGFMADKSGLVLRYDPRKTVSNVGLMTEIFRRRRGVRRSFHPLSPLASLGPLTDELLEGNLNDREPLPHGADSAYYRFCRKNGLVISIGVPLIKYLTVLHVAEEVRDREWRVPGFFHRRSFKVRSDGDEREWIVRERRPEFVRSLALSRLRRDLIREGILHESDDCGVRVDWAGSGDVMEMMNRRNRTSTYPYYFPRLATL